MDDYKVDTVCMMKLLPEHYGFIMVEKNALIKIGQKQKPDKTIKLVYT